MTEIWKKARFRDLDLPYEVSSLGSVRRIPGRDCGGRMRSAVILSPGLVSTGYHQVTLYKDRVKRSILVHSIVAFTFLGDPPTEYSKSGSVVNHLNGIKTDNRAENLEWSNASRNQFHASLTGLMRKGDLSARGKLKTAQVLDIRARLESGERQADLAREYNVSGAALSQIARRKFWRHV